MNKFLGFYKLIGACAQLRPPDLEIRLTISIVIGTNELGSLQDLRVIFHASSQHAIQELDRSTTTLECVPVLLHYLTLREPAALRIVLKKAVGLEKRE